MQLSIDIETLGSGKHAKITQIGVVSFDFGHEVQEAIEILDNPDRWLNVYPDDRKGTTERSNVAFWNKPEQALAKKQIDDAPKVPLEHALAQLSAFVGSYLGKRANVWAYPPAFDLRVLRDAYTRCQMPVPWHYKQEGCLRTLVWSADRVPRIKFRVPSMDSQGLVKHNALHDAVEQAVLAQAANKALLLQARDDS